MIRREFCVLVQLNRWYLQEEDMEKFNCNQELRSGVTMSVISVRVDKEVIRQIEELGYTPSEYIRQILIRELKKERSQKAIAWLETHRLPGGEKLVEEEISEDRDLK